MTKHPCAGMTSAQRRDFERIVIGQRPLGGFRVIQKLKDRGLIEDAPPLLVFGRLGPITVPNWQVPVPVHMQWCAWAAERMDDATRTRPGQFSKFSNRLKPD